MNRTERIYRIEQLLQDRKFVSKKTFLDELEVSPATFKRDLDYLRDRMHSPIEWDRDAGGYRMTEKKGAGPRHQLPGLWFNDSEIYALLTMEHLLENIEPGLLGPHVQPLLARLRTLVESADQPWKEVRKRIRVLHAGKRRAPLKHFGEMASALLKRKRATIRHFNRQSGAHTERTVSPQRMVFYRDNWYLDAWCHLRKDIRSFAVDAILGAHITKERADNIAEDELDAVLGSGYGIFGGRKVQWATLRFSPQRARWVAAEEWHPKQKAKTEADGSYVLQIPYSDDRELTMDILKHGPEVEVVAPAPLRRKVVDLLASARAQYAPGKSRRHV